MNKIIAGVDSSLAARPVLAAARALGELLGAEVEALHVRANDDRAPRELAAAVNVELRVVKGDVLATIVAAAAAPDVVAIVIGARGMPNDPRPLGSTAEAVATTLLKPVLVVPPEAEPTSGFRHALVPLEGTVSSSLAPRSLIEVARGTDVEIDVVHVVSADSIPAFTDQPQHEQAAWAREFLTRYCPWGIAVRRFEARVGRSEDVIPAAAREWGCDLIALGWSQELSYGRARVVRGALERSQLPVLLVPVRAGTATSVLDEPRAVARGDRARASL
jgi:nucleotide-binding universal stress UspA family protein